MNKSDAVRILFNRTELTQVCRYTSMNLVHVGELWVEAWSSPADLGTMQLNNWAYRVL
jgi:hypothetical protein